MDVVGEMGEASRALGLGAGGSHGCFLRVEARIRRVLLRTESEVRW